RRDAADQHALLPVRRQPVPRRASAVAGPGVPAPAGRVGRADRAGYSPADRGRWIRTLGPRPPGSAVFAPCRPAIAIAIPTSHQITFHPLSGASRGAFQVMRATTAAKQQRRFRNLLGGAMKSLKPVLMSVAVLLLAGTSAYASEASLAIPDL